MTIARTVYVISDLHIGGAYPDKDALHDERKRGFRMMTRVAELASFIRHLANLPAAPPVELVINGDFVDFLAEELGSGGELDEAAAPQWSAFRAGRGEALAAFRAIVARDQDLFTALRELLAAGKALTILLGNHDLELCLPDVRAELERELGPGTLRFLDDDQALDLGDVLIDHGNLFDPANVVDHDKLRVLRAVYSRGWFDQLDDIFTPPAGSKLVAEVMNPIKIAYGFVDLLKPESEPLFALLLALEPSYRSQLDDAATALAFAARSLVPRRNVPYAMRNVSGKDVDGTGAAVRNVSSGGQPPPSALDDLIATLLVDDAAAAATLKTAGVTDVATATPVSGGTWRARWSLFRMLIGDDQGDLASRIPQVQATLRVLAKDQSFDDQVESKRYLDAAKWLATDGQDQKGYRAVIFGHTHHAKDLTIPGTSTRYFNTGTWANLMTFPAVFTDPAATPAEVTAALVELANRLKTNDLKPYLAFRPSYVRVDLDADGKLVDAELRNYNFTEDKL